MKRQNAIFERAVKKFKSDVALWVEYIEHAKRQVAPALVGRIAARYSVLSQFYSDNTKNA